MKPLQASERIPGITCPSCGGFIPTSITELLTARSLQCPLCQLLLSIDKQQSRQALNALEKVDNAQKRVEKTQRFNR